MTASTEPPAVPGSVRASCVILYVAAALSVIVAAITLISWGTIVHQTVAAGVAEGTIRAYLTVNVILEVLFAVAFVFLTFRIRGGSNGARILLTVIVVLFALLDILGGTTLLTVVTILVELVAVALLYLPRTAIYFTPDKHRDPAAG